MTFSAFKEKLHDLDTCALRKAVRRGLMGYVHAHAGRADSDVFYNAFFERTVARHVAIAKKRKAAGNSSPRAYRYMVETNWKRGSGSIPLAMAAYYTLQQTEKGKPFGDSITEELENLRRTPALAGLINSAHTPAEVGESAASPITSRRIRGTAILDEGHAEQELGRLVSIERRRDQARGQLSPSKMAGDAKKRDRATISRDALIDALAAYAIRSTDVTALAPMLSALFEVALWSDAEAYLRRRAYAELGGDFLAKMDMTRPHSVRLGMELAHVFHVNGDWQNGARVLRRLPGLQDLPDDPATAKALLRRADTVYTIGELSLRAMSGFLIERFGSHCSCEGASMWRCAACVALKSQRYEDALAYVEECKRQLSAISSLLLSMEDRLIPAYLGVITTIAKVNMRPQLVTDEAAIKNLEAILAFLKEQAVGYEPLIIGIRSEIIKLRRNQMRHKVHDIEQNSAAISVMKEQIKRTIDKQIKVMCFFDLTQIKQELATPVVQL